MGQDGAAPFYKGAEVTLISMTEFEQTPFKESPHTWMEITGDRSKAGSSILDKNSNASKGEPPLKPLPLFFRIGAAPIKPPKPDYLKLRLRKWQDKIIFAKRVTTAARTCKQGRSKTNTVINIAEPH